MEKSISFVFLTLLTACSVLATEAPTPGNVQFINWLESESIASDFKGKKIIPVLRTDVLCEHLDCDEALTVDDKSIVFWSREDLFQRGILNEETLIVGISEQDGELYFNR